MERQTVTSALRDSNVDAATVACFGEEWSRFDQSRLSAEELTDLFELYFRGFPW